MFCRNCPKKWKKLLVKELINFNFSFRQGFAIGNTAGQGRNGNDKAAFVRSKNNIVLFQTNHSDYILPFSTGFAESSTNSSTLSFFPDLLRVILLHLLQRWKTMKRPDLIWEAIGFIKPPQVLFRSPGISSSTCLLMRQWGQWLV